MFRWVAAVLLLLLPFSLALYSPGGPVELLTASNFDAKVVHSDDDTIYMVEFFAPWCGHCKNLAPEWEKAARGLKGFVHVAAVDATQEQALASRFQVQGFPTILTFGGSGGKATPQKYEGGRTADAIVDAGLKLIRETVKAKLSGKKKSSSSSGDRKESSGGSGHGGHSEVIELTEDNFEKEVLDSGDAWLVEFFAPWCGHCKNLAPEFAAASVELKGVVKLGAVDATVHKDLASKYGVQGYPTLKFFPPSGKDAPVDFSGGRTSSGIVQWCTAKMDELGVAPEVKEVTTGSAMQDSCYSRKLCVVAVLPHLSDGGAAARNEYVGVVQAVAKALRAKPISFVWIQGILQGDFEQTFGVGGAGYPALTAISTSKMRYSNHRKAFTAEHVTRFLKDVWDGVEKSSPFKKLPDFKDVTAWGGEDYVAPVEDSEE